jgi:hypothetical protein
VKRKVYVCHEPHESFIKAIFMDEKKAEDYCKKRNKEPERVSCSPYLNLFCEEYEIQEEVEL